MKKLLVLLLVLGMTSWASADIISAIRINNDAQTTMADITIDLTAGMSSAVDGSGGYWALISSSTDVFNTPDAANPVGGGATTALVPDASGIYGDAGDTGLLPYGVGVYGFFGSYGVTWSTGAGAYADSFTGNNEYVSLFLIDDFFSTATHVKTVRVPEPMTVALLGLGGLFMLRRRK
jgi:hypothetical protein